MMLSDLNSWKTLTKTTEYIKNSTFHYKYINEIFNLWQSKDVFKKAYIKLLNEHYFKLSNIKKTKNINLFIDSTYIINKYGIEDIATNPEYRKKKVTKLSAIMDQEKNVLAIIPISTQISKSGKSISFPHDLTSVQPTLDDMFIDIPKYIRTKCAGDKAYITQKSFDLNGKNISIIAPKRKNQKTKNTKIELKILTKRYRVENGLCNIKNKNRLMVRKDKKISTFMGFVFLSLLQIFCLRYKLQ